MKVKTMPDQTFKEKLQSILQSYFKPITEYTDQQKQNRLEKKSEPLYKSMELMDVMDIPGTGSMKIYKTKGGNTYNVGTYFGPDGITVMETGSENNIPIAIKNVYPHDYYPGVQPISSDTLVSGIPTSDYEYTRDLLKVFK
jgi:hypothetical protein